MAEESAPTKAHEPESSSANQAFVAARKFVEHLAMLADWARRFDRNAPLYPPGTYGHVCGHDEAELADGSPRVPLDWDTQAFNFAEAFIAWDDLTHLLTPAVCTEARRVYPPGSPAIKLGKAKPTPTVIEAVADELGVYFRNTVYAGRRHPLEPDCERVADEAKARATARQVAQGKPAEPFGWSADFDELMKKETRAAVRERLGIKTYGDCQDLMMREWKAQDRARGESALSLLRCGSIDFDDLQTQLIREAEAVIAAASKPSAPTIDPAGVAEIQASRAAIERVAEEIKSRDARDDDDGHAKPPAIAAHAGEYGGPALTPSQSRVLKAMALFDAAELVSSEKTAQATADTSAMPPLPALSDETTRKCVVKLIGAKLAERPEGDRSGARLTIAGRRLAGKIAD